MSHLNAVLQHTLSTVLLVQFMGKRSQVLTGFLLDLRSAVTVRSVDSCADSSLGVALRTTSRVGSCCSVTRDTR